MPAPSHSTAHSELYLKLHELYLANAAETNAKNQRFEIERQVLEKLQALYGALATDGAKTFIIDNYKISVTNKTNFTAVSKDQLSILSNVLPEAVIPKLEINETYLKKLRNETPDLYLRVTPYITSKPAKTTIKIINTQE